VQEQPAPQLVGAAIGEAQGVVRQEVLGGVVRADVLGEELDGGLLLKKRRRRRRGFRESRFFFCFSEE